MHISDTGDIFCVDLGFWLSKSRLSSLVHMEIRTIRDKSLIQIAFSGSKDLIYFNVAEFSTREQAQLVFTQLVNLVDKVKTEKYKAEA